MALIKTITKIMPTYSTVGIHLKLEDDDHPFLGAGTHTVIDEDVTENYTKGGNIDDVKNALIKDAQELITQYIDWKKLYKHNKYTNFVTAIDNSLDITE